MEPKDTLFKNIILSGFIIAVVGTIIIVLSHAVNFLFTFYLMLINFVMGLTVFSQDWKNEVNRSFGFIVLCIVAWTMAIFLYWGNYESNLAFWSGKAAHLTAAFIPATFVYLTLIFPQRRIYISGFLRSVIFIPGAVQIVLILFDLVIAGVRKSAFGYDLVRGSLYSVWTVYFIGYMLWAFLNLLHTMRSSPGRSAIQARYIFLAFLLGSIFPITTNIIFPIFDVTYFTQFGPSFTIFIVGITAYAITKHHLMDISVIINRAAAKGIAAVVFIAVYLVIFWSYQTYAAHSPNYFFAGWNILYGILVFHTFSKLRFFIQTSSEKVFLRGKYNYYKELAIAVGRISRNLSRKEVLLTLSAVFYDVIEASNPRVYLPGDFDKPEVKALLSVKELTFKEDDLVLPCLFDGKPMALIVLGPKFSEDAYTDEDLRLLAKLAEQTAIALDHCRLCEEMLGAQKQLLMADKLSSLGKVAAGLAHEIKNPLTAIKGMTQGLSRNLNDPETQADFMAVVPKEIDRLSRLVENLSNLGKTPKFQFSKVNVNLLLENNLKLFESRCRKQGISIVNDLGTLPEIEADGERLTQVFTNLILNAIQAMPDGGKLEIRTQGTEHRLQIEIIDTGQGMPEDKLKDIFEPFFTTKEEGTGLGLAITRKIIEDHGGEIKAESAVGKGTKFRIELPYS